MMAGWFGLQHMLERKPKDEIDECSRLLDCLSRHVAEIIPMWDDRNSDAKNQLDDMSHRADVISRKLAKLAGK